MTNTSVTLQETGIADAIDGGGPYDSARTKMMALDYATQLPEMKAIAGQPDYALGSVHAITREGTLVIASASGSQLASYAWGAANVIFVVGAQKLVPSLEEAHERDRRAQPAARGRPRLRRLRHEQPRRQDPRDPPGGSRPHPRRPHPPAGRVLRRRSDAGETPANDGAARGGGRSRPRPRRPLVSSSSTATTNAPTRGRRFARSNGSNDNSPTAFASPSGTSRSQTSTRTRSRRRPPPRQPRSKTASGRCTGCSFIARRRSRTTTCGATPPSSNSTSSSSTRTGPTRASLRRIRRDVESGLASGEVRGTPTLFIDGVVHRGGYDAATLLEALAR